MPLIYFIKTSAVLFQLILLLRIIEKKTELVMHFQETIGKFIFVDEWVLLGCNEVGKLLYTFVREYITYCIFGSMR